MIMSEKSLLPETDTLAEAPSPTVSAGAVSQEESPVWCVAIVKRNSEKDVRDKLTALGYEAYAATQTMRGVKYAKRKPKDVEYVRLPAKVFIRLRFKDHREEDIFLREHNYIYRFMPDYASRKDSLGRSAIAEIKHRDLMRMRGWLDDEDNEVVFGFPDASYEIGGWVKVVSGKMEGETGCIASKNGKSYIVLEIKGLSWARVQVSTKHLEPIPNPNSSVT